MCIGLATEVFKGNLPAKGKGWIIIEYASDEQRSTTNKSVNWGARDAFNWCALDHAPQLMSCNYYVQCNWYMYVPCVWLWVLSIQEFDYVFDIELDEGGPSMRKLKLPYNRDSKMPAWVWVWKYRTVVILWCFVPI